MQGFQEYMFKKFKLASKSVVGRGNEERLAQAIYAKDWDEAWKIGAAMADKNPRELASALRAMPEARDARSLRPILDNTMSQAALMIAMTLDGDERALSSFMLSDKEAISADKARARVKMALDLGCEKLALAMAIRWQEITFETLQEYSLLKRVADKGPDKEGRGLAWALTLATKHSNDIAGVMLLKEGARGFEKSWAPIAGGDGEALLISMIGRGEGMENSAALLIDQMMSSGGPRKVELLEREVNGKTALTEAIRVNNAWLGIKLANLQPGEKLLANGSSPLMMALKKPSSANLKIADAILLNVVRKARQSLSQPRLPGEEMIEAAQSCNQSVLASVIKAGAELSGKTAVELLHFAIDNGHRALVSAIIARATCDQALIAKVEKGFILESLGTNGLGALARASSPKCYSYYLSGEVMAELLAAGASGDKAKQQLGAWAEKASLYEFPEASRAIDRLYEAIEVAGARSPATMTAPAPILPEIERVRERLQVRAATSRRKITEALRKVGADQDQAPKKTGKQAFD